MRLVRAVLQQGRQPSAAALNDVPPALVERCRLEWDGLQAMRNLGDPPTVALRMQHPAAAAHWAAELHRARCAPAAMHTGNDSPSCA